MFIEEVVDQDSSVYDAFYNKYYEGWSEEFEKHKHQMKFISKMIDDKEKEVGSYYPLKNDLFKCLELTPLNKVKVVIWGQDPYPNPLHATGLAFAVPEGTKPPPPSLRNREI